MWLLRWVMGWTRANGGMSRGTGVVGGRMRGERSSWKLDADGRPPPHFSGSTCSQLGTWVHYLARAAPPV